MAISDAQFTAWLRTDTRRTVLIEQDYVYESGGVAAVGTLYYSDTGYNTAPTDSPPSTRYRSTVKALPKLKRAIDRLQLGGRAEISVSDLRLTNVDGALDYLLDIVLDGYECRVYLGAPEGTPGWTRADFRLAFVAVADRVSAPNDEEIVIRLRDKRMLLNRHIVGNLVGGSGPEANQILPLLYGSCFNVEARLYDAATARYAVLSNYDAGSVVSDVRDAGVSLTGANITTEDGVTPLVSVNTGTEVFTLPAHGLALNDVVRFQNRSFIGDVWGTIAPFGGMSARQYWVISTPTADTFTLSETKGGSSINVTGSTYLGTTGSGFQAGRLRRTRFFDDLPATGRIQLSSSATGRVTVDLNGGAAATTPFAFMQGLVGTWGKLSSSDIDAAAFTASDTVYAGKIGTVYHNYGVLGRENLLDVLDRLCESAFGWVGVSRLGKITCGLVDVSGIGSSTATRTLTTTGLADGAQFSVENDPVGIGIASIQYDRNYTIQTDGLATSVTEANRRAYANAFAQVQRSTGYSGTAYATNPNAYHRTMVEGEPTALGETSDYLFGLTGIVISYPTGIANEIVADASPHRQFINAKCRMDHYDTELGEVVRLVYARYGMASGVNARVIEVELDLTAGEVNLGLVRQNTPDITTASH